jgi:lipid II:glycine glycyltransferase (peptidoglycan interpeptide bridge formation enzyme)
VACLGTIEKDAEHYHPANKEQRDTLFAKMEEAGYEWDAEKKELKKKSQRMISAEAKEAMYDNSGGTSLATL